MASQRIEEFTVAQRTIVQIEDDIEGGPADETVKFGLDGQMLEIDLNSGNASRLRDALGEFMDHGRKVGSARKSAASRGRARSFSGTAGSAGMVDSKAVREWAEQNGHEVSTRGRISKKILDAFKAATG